MNTNLNIIEISSKINAFIAAKGLQDDSEFLILKQKYAIDDPKKLESTLNEVSNIDRLLRIGIIGRVKAGKSSLLNALLFEGRNVLPKAATPMTAALTRMEYSENIKAEVEFYSEQDIQDINKKSQKYEELFNSLKQSFIEELQKNQNNNASIKAKLLNKIDQITKNSEIEKNAENLAKAELEKNEELTSCYDQAQRIKNSRISLNKLNNVIEANTTKELMGKLNDYVGANGKYMPFTKSVKLYIPETGLKGLEIIDTPGVNDPVQSREARTNEILSTCDVVLVVSPAGQFLSREDMQLITRVTSNKGTQYAYLIASQVDTQLFGTEYKAFHSPSEILNTIAHKLKESAQNSLAKLVEEGGNSEFSPMKKLAELFQKHSIICSSSLAFNLLANFNDRAKWDENSNHIFKRLTERFPDYFSDDSAKFQLKELANIEKIKDILSEIKENKIKIQEEKYENTLASISSNFRNYLEEVKEAIENRIDEINSKDIELEKEKLTIFQENKQDIEDFIKNDLKDLIEKLESDLKSDLVNTLNSQTRILNKENQVSVETKSKVVRDWKYEENSITNLWGLLDKDKIYFDKTVHYDETSIRAGYILEIIRGIRDNLETQLNKQAKEAKNGFRQDFIRQIFQGIKEICEDGERIERRKVNNAVQAILAKVPSPDFEIKHPIPASVEKRGRLIGNEAISFSKNADDYMFNKLKPAVRQEIDYYIRDIVGNLDMIELADSITSSLEKEIIQLVNEIENKEETKVKYNRILNELGKLQLEVK